MKKILVLSLFLLSSSSTFAQTATPTTASEIQKSADAIIKQKSAAQAQSQNKSEPKIIIQETPEKIAAKKAEAPQAKQTTRLPYALNPQKFFGNSVEVMVPSTFVTADDLLIQEKFPDKDNYPKIVLTDNSKRPLLSMNITQSDGQSQTIIHFFRDIKNDIRTKYPTSRFLKTDVIRNRTLAIIEVILPNKDGQNLYNMMAMRYVGDKFFFLNFSCPEEDMAQWQDSAREIAENIKIVAAE